MRFLKQTVAYLVVVICLHGNSMFPFIAEAQIAFTSYRAGKPDIYVMDEDGGNVRKIIDHPWALQPAWSPDGKKIAFHGWGRGLYITEAEGGQLPLFVAPIAYYPAWSPKGDKIAGTAPHPARQRSWTLVIADIENGDRQEPVLHIELTGETRPAWSPGGNQIAIGDYLVDVETFEVTDLVEDFVVHDPVWSPDGTQMAFTHDNHIYIMQAAGTGIHQLTNSPAWDSLPTWSPDGQRIAFTSSDREIYVIDVDGQNLRNLTNQPGIDDHPAWFVSNPAEIAPAGKLATSWGALKRRSQ